MPENAQNKARRFIAKYYNEKTEEGRRHPITARDIRILFWRNVVQDNEWIVAAWVRETFTSFYLVTHDKSTLETRVQAYLISDSEIYKEETS